MGAEMMSDDAVLLLLVMGVSFVAFAVGGGLFAGVQWLNRKMVSKRRSKLRGATPNKRH